MLASRFIPFTYGYRCATYLRIDLICLAITPMVKFLSCNTDVLSLNLGSFIRYHQHVGFPPLPLNPTMLSPKSTGAPCATLPAIPPGSLEEVSRACTHISLPSTQNFRSRSTTRFFCYWACVPFRSARARESCAREMAPRSRLSSVAQRRV